MTSSPPLSPTQSDRDTKPSLISADRLGALLQSKRAERGLELDELAHQSDGGFTSGYLSRAEQGLVLLTDPVAKQLVELYDLDPGSISPERNNKLIVDLPGRRLAVGSQSFDIGGTTDPLSGDQLVDAVLERYLSLLYLLRGVEPGRELAIRDDDMAVLGQSLEVELAKLERRLAQLMLDESVDNRTRSLIGRFLLPNCGLLVAATVIGSFVISSVSPDEIVGAQTTAGANGSRPAAEQLIEAPSFPTTIIAQPGQSEASTTDPPQAAPPTTEQSIQARSATVPTEEPTGSSEASSEGSTEAPEVESTGESATTSTGESTGTSTAASETQTADGPSEAPTELAATDPTTLGVEAEALISYDWRAVLPGWRVSYLTDRPGYRGLTFPQTRSIEIYVDADDTPGSIAEILAHELGHAIDVTHFGGAERAEWIEARDMPAVWWAGDGLNDFSVGAGDFAEAVARLWVGSPSNSTYGEFTPDQLRLAQELLP